MNRSTTRRVHSTWIVWASLVICVGAVGLALFLQRTTPSRVESTLPGGPPTGPQATPTSMDYPLLGADVLETLAAQGTTFEPRSTSTSPTEAIKVAGDSFGQTVGKEPVAVAYGLATVFDYGTELSGPGEPSKLDLLIDHRAVWVIQFADVEEPLLGPPDSNGKAGERTATFYKVNLVVFVDAQSNEFLRAETAS